MSRKRYSVLKNGDLSMGDVARLCHVSPRKAGQWVDSGLLKGYRHPGVRRDRRVTRAVLAAFIRRHGLPFPKELETIE